MYATHIDARQSKSTQAVPGDRKPVSEHRSGKDMLADEVLNVRPRRGASYAEAALMCAVLEDAVDCFQKQFSCATRRAKHLGREAEHWLFSDDPNWLFSFVAICNVLELCPQYIRQGLMSWRDGGRVLSHKQATHEVSAEERKAV